MTLLRVFVLVLDINDNAPVFPFVTKVENVSEVSEGSQGRGAGQQRASGRGLASEISPWGGRGTAGPLPLRAPRTLK